MFVLRLLSVVVKFALVAAVIVGGVYVYENRESIGKAISGSGQAPIDYNCSLPGSGFPWLKHEPVPDPPHGGAPLHMGGIFVSTVPRPSEPGWGVELPVRIREDGTLLSSMADVYRMLCAVHPDLGGSGVRPMTPEEKRSLDCCDPDPVQRSKIPYLYTDGVMRAADEAHLGFERIRLYLLPPIPKDLRDALATSVASRQTPTPAPSPSPTATPETRRYRIVVNGYERTMSDPYWRDTTKVRQGVRFDYRLIGEFVLERATSSKPWTVRSSRVVIADVKYSSLYSVNRYKTTLTCANRSCERLQAASRLHVTVDGDEIVVRWGSFHPMVKVTATCVGCPEGDVKTEQESGFFAMRINGERLPLEDLHVGPKTISWYGSGPETATSFAYGLERLP